MHCGRTREADADDLCVDGGTAAFRVVQLLEHEHRAAFGEREAVAALVERTRRMSRVLVVSVDRVTYEDIRSMDKGSNATSHQYFLIGDSLYDKYNVALVG